MPALYIASSPSVMPLDQGGIGVTSLLVDTAQACAQLLTRVLNDTNNTNTDPSSIAIIAATSMRRQLDGLGHLRSPRSALPLPSKLTS
jgi:hypothetical protein